jgi:hypothetical protein
LDHRHVHARNTPLSQRLKPALLRTIRTTRLAADPALLKRFIFLLGADRVVPPKGDSHLYELPSQSVANSPSNSTPPTPTSAKKSSPGFVTRTPPSFPRKFSAAPKNSWIAFSSAPFAKTAACCEDALCQNNKEKNLAQTLSFVHGFCD